MPEWIQNWKTACAGLAIVFLGIGFCLKLITLNEFLTAFAFVCGGGLLAAKDAGKK